MFRMSKYGPQDESFGAYPSNLASCLYPSKTSRPVSIRSSRMFDMAEQCDVTAY